MTNEEIPVLNAINVSDTVDGARQLDPVMQETFDRATELSVQKKQYAEAAEILGELLKEVSEKYGQLSPLLGPIYYRYGDTLLANVEESSEALGSSDAAASQEGSESEDGEEEKDSESEGEVEANVTESSVVAEEDLTEKENQDEADPDDLQVAWECLDVARVIYEKLGDPAALELSQVFLRLGDCHMESDTFDKAVEEYSKCLALRAPRVSRHDRRLSDVLSSLMNAHLSLATKSGVEESSRSNDLRFAEQYCQAAAESMIEAAIFVAKTQSMDSFVSGAEKEIEGGVVTKRFPPGLVTSAVGLSQVPPASSSSSSLQDGTKYEECTVRIFTNLYTTTLGNATVGTNADGSSSFIEDTTTDLPLAYRLGNASSGRIVKLSDACDVADLLLQRLQEIRSDMSINVETLRSEIDKDPSAPVHSVGFDNSAPAPTGPVAILAPRRKIAVDTASKSTSEDSNSECLTKNAVPPAGSDASEGSVSTVGAKRPLENPEDKQESTPLV